MGQLDDLGAPPEGDVELTRMIMLVIMVVILLSRERCVERGQDVIIMLVMMTS
jgi:hypothetical protein